MNMKLPISGRMTIGLRSAPPCSTMNAGPIADMDRARNTEKRTTPSSHDPERTRGMMPPSGFELRSSNLEVRSLRSQRPPAPVENPPPDQESGERAVFAVAYDAREAEGALARDGTAFAIRRVLAGESLIEDGFFRSHRRDQREA